MRAHILYGPEGEPRVRCNERGITVECVVTVPPSAAEQTVWLDLTPDAARALRRRLGAALTGAFMVEPWPPDTQDHAPGRGGW